jgi:hypothetical protein
MKTFVFWLALLLNSLTILGQPISKKYINNSIDNTEILVKQKIFIVDVKVYPRIGHKTSMKENRDFVHKLSNKSGLDTNYIWKKIKMCSGNDSLSYKYLMPEAFWDTKSDSVRNIIFSTVKYKDPKNVNGWYIYVYFKTEKTKIIHESYTEINDYGKVEKFLIIQ